MMPRLVDVVPEMNNATDAETHRTRGKRWESKLRKEFDKRKAKAAEMLRSNRPENSVFRIAQVNALPVMTVRDIEAAILADMATLNEMTRKRVERFVHAFGTTTTNFEVLSGIQIQTFLEGEILAEDEIRSIDSFLDRMNEIEV